MKKCAISSCGRELLNLNVYYIDTFGRYLHFCSVDCKLQWVKGESFYNNNLHNR